MAARLDLYLLTKYPDLSRSRIQSLISDGFVTVNGKPATKPAQKLTGQETIELHLPAPKPTTLVPQDLPLSIIYEDADIIVINKPAGMAVHPGAGRSEGTLVNALIHRYPDLAIGDTHRPGLVHRLDKDTSGVMVCARHDKAHQRLSAAFKSREVHKIYRAFAIGTFKKEVFELITGHARHKTDRKRFTTNIPSPLRGEGQGEGGIRLAHSKFQVLLESGGIAELSVELLTGRTHQIRAHLADIGHPLVQDALYGGTKATKQLKPGPVKDVALTLTRHALHAELLRFNHPVSGKNMSFNAPLPDDLAKLHEAMI